MKWFENLLCRRLLCRLLCRHMRENWSNSCPSTSQIRTFFARAWKRSPVPYGEDAILADLTAPLRSKTLCCIGLAHRARLPLLAALGDECLGHIVTLLWAMPLVRCDEIH